MHHVAVAELDTRSHIGRNRGPVSRISASLLLASMVMSSLVILTTATKAAAASPTTNSHWAGFVTEDASQANVRGAFGKWTVPPVTCASNETSFSVTWVGIGGALTPKGKTQGNDESLYQVGTGSSCVDGAPEYLAWVEDTGLPNGFDSVFDFDQDPNIVVLGCQTNVKCSGALSVEPGDAITAAVVDHGVYTRWTISDDRHGKALWSHNKTWLTHAHRHSGECIEEDPQLSNGRFGPMSNFWIRYLFELSGFGSIGEGVDGIWLASPKGLDDCQLRNRQWLHACGEPQ